jgi:hypothetical protein
MLPGTARLQRRNVRHDEDVIIKPARFQMEERHQARCRIDSQKWRVLLRPRLCAGKLDGVKFGF